MVRAERPHDTARLLQAIEAVQRRESHGLGPPVLAMARGSLRRPLHVTVVPPPAEVMEWPVTKTVSAVLFVTDPEEEHGPSPALLQTAYGLTRTEAVVAAHMACGRGVAEIARIGGTSSETVRTQLKQVFRKTGTSSQVDLLALLTSVMGRLVR